jgi:alcohol dehydrogenase
MTVYRAPTTLLHGIPAPEALGSVLREQRWTRVGVVTDATVAALPEVATLLDRLTATAEHLVVHAHHGGEPSTDDADEAAARLRDEDLHVVVGVGGGSPMDLAKAAAVLVANPAPAASYQGVELVERAGLPILCVPTTAGSGSEVTFSAVLTNHQAAKKRGISTMHAMPRYAILDPRLTVPMPPGLTISTGMDAVAHAAESYVSPAASPITRMLAVQALGLLHQGIARAAKDPRDLEARDQAQLGCVLAGWACDNAGVGAPHALSYAAGTHFGVPHGVGIAAVLTPTMAVLGRRRRGLYDGLHDELRLGGEADDSERKLARLSDHLDGPARQAGITFRLRDHGVTPDDLKFLARRARTVPAIDNQPVGCDEQDCVEILRAAL